MKKIIILLCLVLSAMLLASCDNAAGDQNQQNSNGGDNCEHSYADGWTMNATHHWHAATCDHGETKSAYAEHDDAEEDGICNSCSYPIGHSHSFSSDWERDVKNHWKAATCTHTSEISEFGLHVDDNSDSKCDFCEAHVHVITTAGKCLGCGEQIKVVDTSDTSSVIASLIDHQSNINGGKIVSNFIGRYNNSAQSTKTNKIIEYLFGDGSAYYKSANAAEVHSSDRGGVEYVANTSDIVEKWQSLEAGGNVFGVYRETVNGVPGELNIEGGANINTLSGYYYSVSTLASGYGAEGILKALYDRSQETGSSDFVVEEDEGYCKFSFNYLAINSTNTSDNAGNSLGIVHNVNYFIVTVEFNYTANYELTNLSINCDCYTSDAGSNLQGDLDIDNIDLEYAALTGKIELSPDAKADTYIFTVEQTVGERSFTNPYGKDYFTPSDFNVYSDREGENLCPDTITISLTNLPEDELYPYVRFRIIPAEADKLFTEADSITFTSSDNSGLRFASFDPVRTMGSFLAKTTGTYTVTIDVNGSIRTFTVIVTA